MGLHVGNSEEAERRVRDVCDRFPEYSPARFRNGVLLAESGEFESALKEFAAVSRLTPEFPESKVSRAEVYILLGQPEVALKLLEEAGAAHPGYRRIHYVRGLALLESGEISEAEGELAKGRGASRMTLGDKYTPRLEVHRVGYQAMMGRAGRLIQARDYRRAITLLEKILAGNPEDPSVLSNIAVAHLELGNHKRALRYLEVSRAANPGHFETSLNLTKCLLAMGKGERALKAACDSVEINSLSGAARYYKSKALRSSGREVDAIVELRNAVRLDPSLVVALAEFAEHLSGSGRHGEAEPYWRAVTTRSPDHIRSRIRLIDCLLVQGKMDIARHELLEARTLAPENSDLQRISESLEIPTHSKLK